jgi:hypothetical protein
MVARTFKHPTILPSNSAAWPVGTYVGSQGFSLTGFYSLTWLGISLTTGSTGSTGFYRVKKTGSTGTRNGKITRIFMNIMFWSFFNDPKRF